MPSSVPETDYTNSSRVACDGGPGGHPLVWLQVPADKGWTQCPYCAKRIEMDGQAVASH